MPKADIVKAKLKLWHQLYVRKIKADEAVLKAIETVHALDLEVKQATQAYASGKLPVPSQEERRKVVVTVGAQADQILTLLPGLKEVLKDITSRLQSIEYEVSRLPSMHQRVLEGLYRDRKPTFLLCKELKVTKRQLDQIHRHSLNLLQALA